MKQNHYFQNFWLKDYITNWTKEVFVIKEVKQFHGHMRLNVQVIPYINQGNTSISFHWTEFVIIVWNSYINWWKFISGYFWLRNSHNVKNCPFDWIRCSKPSMFFDSKQVFKWKRERVLLWVNSFNVCSWSLLS